MFRKINLKNGNNEDKLLLYKNAREIYCEIPIEYIENVDYEFQKPSVIRIAVPNKTVHNGVTVNNHIFDKILGKRQKIEFNGVKFVITDCDRNDTKDKKVKTVTAKSIDVTLEDSHLYCPRGGFMKQLVKKEEEYETADGYLDLFVEQNPSWKIGHVDESARIETNRVLTDFEVAVNNISSDSVALDTVLFEQAFDSITTDNNNSLNVKIIFRDVNSYNKETNALVKTELKIADLGRFHTNITNIKGIYTTTDKFRYAIKFEITLADNSEVTRECEFLDLKNYNVRCENIKLLYTNGTTEIKSMNKYRNLEENVYNWRSVLVDMITDAFDCYVIFDCKEMTINCYDKKTYGESKGVYLSYENYIKSINKKYRYDQIVTKLEVTSDSEGLSIVDENPLGTNFLLSYDYFIDKGIMSEECASAWKTYVDRIDGVQEPLYDLRCQLNVKNSLKIKIDTEITTLTESAKGLEIIRVAYIKENDTENANRISKEINEKHDKIGLLVKDLAICTEEIEGLKKQIKLLVESIDMSQATNENGDKIFREEDLLEIQDLTISEMYSDKYYTTAYGLFNNSQEILKERNKLQIDFTTNLVGLLQNMIIPKGLKWDWLISLGDKLSIDDDELIDDVRIVKISYLPKDKKITNISFTNRDKEVDDLQSIGNIGRTISRVDNLASSYKVEWEKGMTSTQYVNKLLTDGLNLKATSIRSRSHSVLTDFSESGLFVIDGVNENNQLFLAGGLLCISDDKWETCKVAIDSTGIIAKQLVGEIILGKNLYIANENNSLTIDEEGIIIEANSLKIKGIEGGDYSFTSYFEMMKDKISLGVKNANDYTDSQVKITSDKIDLAVTDGKNYTDSQVTIKAGEIISTVNNADKNLQTQITQNTTGISQKVSNGDFETYKTQTANEIKSKVSSSNLGTEIVQNSEHVKIAWNNTSDYVQFENGGLAIYNGLISTIQKRAFFDEMGNHFWRDGYYLGKIGTNQWQSDNTKKGIVFDLNENGAYMTWASKRTSSDTAYIAKLLFANKDFDSYAGNRLYLGSSLDCTNRYLYDPILIYSSPWFEHYQAGSGNLAGAIINRFSNNSGKMYWGSGASSSMNGIFQLGYDSGIQAYRSLNMNGYSIYGTGSVMADEYLIEEPKDPFAKYIADDYSSKTLALDYVETPQVIISSATRTLIPNIETCGTGRIVDGKCQINFEDGLMYSDYVVGLTAIGRNVVYLAEKNNNHFIVEADTDCEFDYIVKFITKTKEVLPLSLMYGKTNRSHTQSGIANEPKDIILNN